MGSLTLREALDEYTDVYMAYRNFAQRTRVEYQNDLEDFIDYLEKARIHHVREINIPIITRYVAHLEVMRFASPTRKKKAVTIRSFLKFLHQEGMIETNFANKIVLPFAETSKPYILTQTECDRLRNACQQNLRDKSIVELLLQTGIKLSELILLKNDDLEFKNEGKGGLIRLVGGRGTKARLVQLNDHSCIALKNYIGARAKKRNETLFLNRFGKPLGKRGVQKILKKYCRIAGIQGVSAHTLRHTFGFRNLCLGISPKVTQEIMGFHDSRSVSRYTCMIKTRIGREESVQAT